MTGFEITPDMDDHDVDGVGMINDALARLTARRVERIAVEGPLEKSKVAWKVATYKEAQLYRVVELITGCAHNWNRRDVLGTSLAARALIETTAVLLDVDLRLRRLLNREDLKGIDTLIMNCYFSTRDERSIKNDPDVKAVNVITILEGIAKKDEVGRHLKQYYLELSEFCHPNFGGHLGLFGTLDKETLVTTYCSATQPPLHPLVLGAAMSVTLAEMAFNSLDRTVLRLAELQHRIQPGAAST